MICAKIVGFPFCEIAATRVLKPIAVCFCKLLELLAHGVICMGHTWGTPECLHILIGGGPLQLALAGDLGHMTCNRLQGGYTVSEWGHNKLV